MPSWKSAVPRGRMLDDPATEKSHATSRPEGRLFLGPMFSDADEGQRGAGTFRAGVFLKHMACAGGLGHSLTEQ